MGLAIVSHHLPGPAEYDWLPTASGVIDGSDNTMPVRCAAENNQLDAALPIRALLDKGKWQRDQSIKRSSPKLLSPTGALRLFASKSSLTRPSRDGAKGPFVHK